MPVPTMSSLPPLTKAGAPTQGVNAKQTINIAADTEQTVEITGTPTGGTFTLTYGLETTAAIAYNAAAAAVVAALEALTGIGAGGVTATGGALPGTPVVVTFVDSGDAPVEEMVADGALLTGGTDPAVTATITACTPTDGTIRLTWSTTAAYTDVPYNATAAAMQALIALNLEMSSDIVTCTGGPFPGNTITLNYAHGLPVTELSVTDTDLVSCAGDTPTATFVDDSVVGVRGDYRASPAGQILIDTTNRILYYNNGTAYTPAWTEWPPGGWA